MELSPALPVLLGEGFERGCFYTNCASDRPIAQLVLRAFTLEALVEHAVAAAVFFTAAAVFLRAIFCFGAVPALGFFAGGPGRDRVRRLTPASAFCR